MPKSPKAHATLRRLSKPALATLILHEYITNNDPRALNFLKDCWPDIDWLDVAQRVKAELEADCGTQTLTE